MGKKITKVILPGIPNKEFILSKIKKRSPDVILGIGQTGRGKLIRIERRTKNIFQSRKSKKKRKINLKGAEQYLINLKPKKIPGTRISYNAGKYLCNFTMYTIIDFIKKENLKTKFSFIHIPKDYKIQKVIKIIKKLISQIET